MKNQSRALITISTTFSVLSSLATPPPAERNFAETKAVSSTIVITKPGVYDFKNVLHIWKGKAWNCASDKENGPQILRVQASNVTIKNFAFVGDGKTQGSNGLGDPIHLTTCGTGQGNRCSGKLENVVLDNIYGHACEDMITIGTPGSKNITIQNSVLFKTPGISGDKTVQVNFGTNIRFINNRFVGGGICINFKPETTGYAKDNVFEACQYPLYLSSDSADITPMRNGPSEVEIHSNTWMRKQDCGFGGCKRKLVTCNDARGYDTDGLVECR